MNNSIKYFLNIFYMSILSIVCCFLIFSCNIKNEAASNSSTTNLIDSLKKSNSKFYSGKYQDLSIAIEDKKITAVYEYYDRWDEKYQEFLDINVFYFYGRFINDSTVPISAVSLNGKQLLNGMITFLNHNDSPRLRIKLDGQPLGYNDVDFTKDGGIEMFLNEIKAWKEIRFIRSRISKLYNGPSDDKILKSYLIKSDVVKVLNTVVNGFVQIEYSNPILPNKPNIYWLKEIDLNQEHM